MEATDLPTAIVAKTALLPQLDSQQELPCASPAISTGPATSFAQVYAAFKLVHDQYCAAGYMSPRASGLRFFLRELLPSSTVFVSTLGRRVVGTLSAVRATLAGVPASSLFPSTVDPMQRSLRRVVEGSKFACVPQPNESVGPGGISYSVGQLLRWVYHWCRLNGVHDWLAVVNPRHRSFYERKIGFQFCAETSQCAHVDNHPGVLLRYDVLGVASRKVAARPAARELFLNNPLGAQEFQNNHRLENECVLLLLLEDPEVVSSASPYEIALFQRRFSGVWANLERLPRLNAIDARRLSVLPAFGRIYGIESLGADRGIEASIVALRAYFARVFAVLELRAERKGLQLLARIADQVPDALYCKLHCLGELIVECVWQSIEQSLWGEEIAVHIAMGLPTSSMARLTVTLRASVLGRTLRMQELLQELSTCFESETQDHELRFHVAVQISEQTFAAPVYDLLEPCAGVEECPAWPFVEQLSALRVLVIEEALLAERFTLPVLSGNGHQAVLASGATEALQKFRSQVFDLVLLDMRLASVDCFALVSQLRAAEQERKCRTPIIALASLPRRGERSLCYELGIDEYLPECASETLLIQTIRSIAARKMPRSAPTV